GQGHRGEMGDVAIQRDDTPAPRTDEEAEGGLETGRETIALLRDHLDAEPACQLVLVAGGAHDRDSRRADGTSECERVLDEATVERDDRLRRQQVREAGLHVAARGAFAMMTSAQSSSTSAAIREWRMAD